jgi:hypothetical protein
MTRSTTTPPDRDPQPWWRERFMWMVVGGPLAVVVAGFATLAIAIMNPDPVITTSAKPGQPEMPAVQARNHAATPAR